MIISANKNIGEWLKIFKLGSHDLVLKAVEWLEIVRFLWKIHEYESAFYDLSDDIVKRWLYFEIKVLIFNGSFRDKLFISLTQLNKQNEKWLFCRGSVLSRHTFGHLHTTVYCHFRTIIYHQWSLIFFIFEIQGLIIVINRYISLC